MPTLFGKGEGNNQCTAMARGVGIPRGRRPQAGTEAICARTGRSCDYPDWHVWVASRSLRTYGDDERAQEVGQTRSSDEAREQSRPGAERGRVDGGVGGAKGAGRRKSATAKHEPGTGSDRRAKRAGADTASSGER